MNWKLFWREKAIKEATTEYLNNLRRLQNQDREAEVLNRLRTLPQPIHLGQTLADVSVDIPLHLLTNFSVTTGSQGSGKSMFVLQLILAMLRFNRPFGLVDAKG